MVKIEFWNLKDLGNILYSSNFHQVVYLDTIVQTPEYPINQSAKEDGNGNTFFDFQSWDKQRIIETNVQEDLADCLTLLPLHDVVMITDDLYKQEVLATNITANVSWIDQAKMIGKLTIKYSVMSIRRTGKLDNIERLFPFTFIPNHEFVVPLVPIEGACYLEGYFENGDNYTLRANLYKIVNGQKIEQPYTVGNYYAYSNGQYGNIYWKLIAPPSSGKATFIRMGEITNATFYKEAGELHLSLTVTHFDVGFATIYYQLDGGYTLEYGAYRGSDFPDDIIFQDMIADNVKIWINYWIHGNNPFCVSTNYIISEGTIIEVDAPGGELTAPGQPNEGDLFPVAYPNMPDCYVNPPGNTVAYAGLYKFINQTDVEQDYNDFIGYMFRYEAGQYGGIYWKLERPAYVGAVKVGRFLKLGYISSFTEQTYENDKIIHLSVELFSSGTVEIKYRLNGVNDISYGVYTKNTFPSQITIPFSTSQPATLWLESTINSVLVTNCPPITITSPL